MIPCPANDICSAFAFNACCMQRPMKRKVWYIFLSASIILSFGESQGKGLQA